MTICLNFNIFNAPARDLRAAAAKPVIDLQTFQSPCSIDQATNRASRPVIFPSTIRRQAENYTVRLHAALWRRSESSSEGIHSGTTQVAQSAIPPSVSGLGKVKMHGALAGRQLLPYIASLIGRAGGHTTHGFQGFQGCWHFQGCCFEAEKSHATLVLITACARAHYVLHHSGSMVKHSCSLLHTLTLTLTLTHTPYSDDKYIANSHSAGISTDTLSEDFHHVRLLSARSSGRKLQSDAHRRRIEIACGMGIS
ncbi:uncharacterized protein K489DRAFT_368947 [Dissoconium aciculare CBS 342.82]|uniref:Uncharacterized protein n=1 Tax=Dissoconium aciculare CBS 342.82 TaxID=1314786 RepID=A0A6J3M7H8_9PEZI|nr:uncharacterized protein K489DRAFT_368947 [Dissoconium aciculare CBS 342.82]KAF1824016.1 hypothetical protein K489DRAFT_368947 [Dissoconium aciculare CBS 342.82]